MILLFFLKKDAVFENSVQISDNLIKVFSKKTVIMYYRD